MIIKHFRHPKKHSTSKVQKSKRAECVTSKILFTNPDKHIKSKTIHLTTKKKGATRSKGKAIRRPKSLNATLKTQLTKIRCPAQLTSFSSPCPVSPGPAGCTARRPGPFQGGPGFRV